MGRTRQEAYALLCERNKNPALVRHALEVEGVMRRFAENGGHDVEKWGIVGLIHDIDYEEYPDRHCEMTPEILRENGYGEDIIRAACSHGYGICSDIKPEHFMEKVLYAVDELTGLVHACVIMRPSKSAADLEYKSVIKKFRQPSFAAGVDRSVIERGAEALGLDLQYLIEQTILAMREVEAADPPG